jgi:hypothetical protein
MEVIIIGVGLAIIMVIAIHEIYKSKKNSCLVSEPSINYTQLYQLERKVDMLTSLVDPEKVAKLEHHQKKVLYSGEY